MRKIYIALSMAALMILLGGCSNKIEMVDNASVSLSEDGKQLEINIILNDENMEPETSYQVRLFAYDGELIRALGKDLFIFEEEYISHKEGEKSKTIEIKETLPLAEEISEEKLKDIIEDKEENALEIDVLNTEKVFATEEIHKVN
ncbi:hypothetical protein FZC79_07150 [Rossellomorea vietnamensis]|uniref:Uncharacterized protein n=1 Tax=Rossellomorea vietnamensis TaxID=218284 RepID=A0A5D4KIW0_9BACI|nr:hypothetical protein [Rossellomorea vietnamensis]TYR76635.1 hypothetical protein FZC79_07150 [Rossellomorea vietnamensis]